MSAEMAERLPSDDTVERCHKHKPEVCFRAFKRDAGWWDLRWDYGAMAWHVTSPSGTVKSLQVEPEDWEWPPRALLAIPAFTIFVALMDIPRLWPNL